MTREWLMQRRAFLVPAAFVSVCILAAGGFDWCWVGATICLLAAAALAGSGAPGSIPAALLAAGGAALGGGAESTALLTASGLVSCLSGRSFPDRSLGLLGALASAQSGDLSGTLPVLAASLPAAFLDRPLHRGTAAAVLLPAAILVGGFPAASAPREVLVQEAFTPGGETWPATVNVDQSCPSALLRVEDPSGEVLLLLDAGGVRDSLPLGILMAGSCIMPVYPGRDTVVVIEPGPFVEVELVRPPRPFQHPVIHLGPSRSVQVGP